MTIKFKEQLKGKRILLRQTKPTLDTARRMFEQVEINRKHLAPWLPWEKFTKKVEDSMKYLFDKEKETNEGKKIEYGIYVEGEYVGNISMFDINQTKKSGEIGYWISKEFAGKGYVTEAVKVLEAYFFRTIKLNRIQIKCDEKNTASKRVAEKAGYVFEGKRRQDSYCEYYKDFRNTLVFSKLKSEFKKQK
jgi:ribosomal-protein-serine acetyltransferase